MDFYLHTNTHPKHVYLKQIKYGEKNPRFNQRFLSHENVKFLFTKFYNCSAIP